MIGKNRIERRPGMVSSIVVVAAALLSTSCMGTVTSNRRAATAGLVGCPVDAVVVFDGTNTTWVSSCLENYCQCSLAGGVTCAPLNPQFVTPELVARRDAARAQ